MENSSRCLVDNSRDKGLTVPLFNGTILTENWIKGEYDRQCGIFDLAASTNPFSLRLGPFLRFLRVQQSLIMSYRTHGYNITRCDGSKKKEKKKRERERE